MSDFIPATVEEQAAMRDVYPNGLPVDSMVGLSPRSVALRAEAEAQRELDHHRRESIIQHPETGDFLRGALVEAAYQREAWPDQDEAKSDSDWFWTLGYIVGKAVTKDADDPERQLHHIEAGAALLANWHNAIKGRSQPWQI